MNKISKGFAILFFASLISCQQFANNTRPPTPTVSASNSPGSTSGSKDFLYLGKNTDKTSSGTEVKVDTKFDLHFSYTPTFASEAEVKHITISHLEKDKPGIAGWQTHSGTYWVLAVEAGGKKLNTGKIASLGKFTGEIKFDFYGSEVGAEYLNLTNAGTSYQLDMVIAINGKEETLTQKITL